jgi:hypothetical protein
VACEGLRVNIIAIVRRVVSKRETPVESRVAAAHRRTRVGDWVFL